MDSSPVLLRDLLTEQQRVDMEAIASAFLASRDKAEERKRFTAAQHATALVNGICLHVKLPREVPGNSGGVEETVALLEREAADASMWVERHWKVEKTVGATLGGEWPWLDRVAVFEEAGRARVAQEERGRNLRAAAALISKRPTAAATQPVSPQPQLSDEDREALEAKAERFEEHAERCRPVAGTDLATTSLQEAAETIRDFLRKLASQPGVEGEQLTSAEARELFSRCGSLKGEEGR